MREGDKTMKLAKKELDVGITARIPMPPARSIAT